MHTSSLHGLMIINIGQINLYLALFTGYIQQFVTYRKSICIDSSYAAVYQERV